jgi:hypothetical protein
MQKQAWYEREYQNNLTRNLKNYPVDFILEPSLKFFFGMARINLHI